jgi:uncharacterized protein
MSPFSLLLKPASADCNLRCEYCFYLDKCHLYPDTKRHRMSDEILEKLVESYLATPQQTYTFGWQGGEPTLMGVEFFRKVTLFQEKYGCRGTIVANGLQTNATLIDNELAAHLARYNFLLGCSLDGPAEIHNRYRLTAGGTPTHTSVLNGIETLKRHGVEFNILVLVNQANVKRSREVYQYLKSRGYFFHQYIPCVEFDATGNLLPFAINPKEWGEFLCNIFDEWYPQDVERVSIRHFDSILQKMLDGTDNVCTLGRNCCQYFLVEYNGDIYPCDFFVEKDLKIGNVMYTTWEEALRSNAYREFGAQKARWNPDCKSCDCLTFCSGDCLKYRTYAGHLPQNLSWLCFGWQRFIRYTRRRFQKIAEYVNFQRRQKQINMQRQMAKSGSKTVSFGRNAPCPCGSGKKFKRCCQR